MSYSFYCRAKSKAEVLEQVATKFKEVVAQQPVHERDAQFAYDHCKAVIGNVGEPAEGRLVQASVNGYISVEDGVVVGLNVSASVGFVQETQT